MNLDLSSGCNLLRSTLTPALFARTASRGDWKMAPHLKILDRAILNLLIGRTRKRMIVTMPPRHGKSELVSKYLPAWFLGTFPNRRVILTSYEASFAAEWGRHARTIFEEWGMPLFGVSLGKPSQAEHWTIAGHKGSMQTTGAGGPLTGKGADLLIIDDPVKNFVEASSQVIRQRIWNWWVSTAMTRIEPNGSAILIQTRWHEDDLAGRLLREMKSGGPEWDLIKMPALDGDKPLWPARFTLEELLEKKRGVGSYVWSSLYQQEPTPMGGGMFRRQWFRIVDALPADRLRLVRYWDKAGTEGAGDYSVGVLIAEHRSVFYVVDVVRGRWSPHDRNVVIQQTALLDAERFGPRCALWMEEEPGSSGKESSAIHGRELVRFGPAFDRPTGNKIIRARPLAAQAEAGNVRLVEGRWIADFLDELAIFPHGKHDDQVDAASGAFNKLALAVAQGDQTYSRPIGRAYRR